MPDARSHAVSASNNVSEEQPMGRFNRIRQGRDITLLEHIKAGDPAIRRWGFMNVTPRSVVDATHRIDVRFDVWPPELTQAQRAMLRLATLARAVEGWVLGAIIVAVPVFLHRWTVAAILATVLIVGWAVVSIRSRQLRSQIVSLHLGATRDGVYAHPKLGPIFERLQRLDESDLSRSDYEAEWGSIYRSIKQSNSGRGDQ